MTLLGAGLLALVIGSGNPVIPAAAGLMDSNGDEKAGLLARAEVTMKTMQEAIVRAVDDRPGLVSEAEITSMNGAPVFEIEVIDDDGRRYEVYVNGETGETVKIELEGQIAR